MRIIRGRPASGKPNIIVCTGCGKRAPEAGIAIKDDAEVDGWGPDGPVIMIDEDEVACHPLCEDCVAVLCEQGGAASKREGWKQ